MGKSSSGKDTIYKNLLKDGKCALKTYTMYTTRPMREKEKQDREYHFVTEEDFREYKAAGRIIENRVYNTVLGPWRYFTVDDGTFSKEGDPILMIGTLESYISMKDYFGEEKMVPLYIECDDGERLARALKRERESSEPHYREMCRRYLADCEDFSDENLEKAGITKRYRNDDLTECLNEIEALMK